MLSEKLFSFFRYSFSSSLPAQNHHIFILGLLLACGDEERLAGVLGVERVAGGFVSDEFTGGTGVLLVATGETTSCAIGVSGTGGFVGSDAVLVS